ncbi:glycoside hydrolase family 45 protein [Trematosphaeria pertusa]|uniref:cellulase n=1 Tax=Trematosphaeria pertusa TaxID=390896 RepID=A0A6A6J742_9PLEO|nr:glycoside hydrolase family 45 protein [Trematosphaeria pertusa]KAF2257263.1 glycoside hydrolase family 45 protein [Trematosphaeria pertusa]
MTASYLRNLLFLLDLFVVIARCANLNISGEAVTTRFWDCCKPSCGWNGKASFNRPVLSCTADDKPTDIQAGTGCGDGGTAFLCSDQQPWAVNDTFSYGFAGIFLVPSLTDNHIEDAWCCACYQLNFTSDPLRGKTMIVQASNTAYDVNTANRFSLAVPGGNTTSHDACARQYGVDQNVFGTTDAGVSSKEDCDKLPEALQAGCQWRFDWFEDASYPTATFKRVPCPQVLTDKTQCTRDDDKVLAGESAAATLFSPSFSMVAALTVAIVGLLSV